MKLAGTKEGRYIRSIERVRSGISLFFVLLANGSEKKGEKTSSRSSRTLFSSSPDRTQRENFFLDLNAT
jgi:hypothetical protein